MLDTIRWTGSAVELLDQTQLPTRTVYVTISDERQMHDAIRRLVVRGAPVIGVSAAFGVYLGVRDAADLKQLSSRLDDVCRYLKTARPTAVNLAWAVDRIHRHATCHPKYRATPPQLLKIVKQRILDECLAMLDEDARCCRAIGEHGAVLLKSLTISSGASASATSSQSSPHAEPLNVLTHCNAGACVAVRWGT